MIVSFYIQANGCSVLLFEIIVVVNNVQTGIHDQTTEQDETREAALVEIDVEKVKG